MTSFEREIPMSFDEQFLAREVFVCENTKVEFADIVPEVARGLPVFFGPRWLGRISDYEKIVRALHAAGRRVITAELRGTEDKKAAQIDAIFQRKGIERADALTHSVGSLSVVSEALRRNRLFGKLVLLNAPLTGQEPEIDLIRRYIRQMRESASPSRDEGIAGRSRFFDMAREITTFDPWGKMRRILASGTEIFSISALSDTLFPPDRVLAEAQRNGFPIDEWVIFRAGKHLEIEPFIPDALRLLEG